MATADDVRRPSKETEAVIYSWGIRWQCPRDMDPDRYDARLRMLMHDCAPIAPGDLREVGNRLVRHLKFMPSAAEVHDEYRELLAERAAKAAAKAAAEKPESQRTSAIAASLRERNMRLMREGRPFRWIEVEGSPRLVDVMVIVPGEMLPDGEHGKPHWEPAREWRCDGQGGVDHAVWNPQYREREWKRFDDAKPRTKGQQA